MWSGSNELSPGSGKSWPAVFLSTFFPNLTAIDSSRPVWPACPAFPWKTGVDQHGLPNGQPFAVSSERAPTAPGEVHAYWFSLCSTLENCAAGVNGLQPVDDGFYAMTSFASEFGWIGMPSLESLAPVLGAPEEDYTMHSKAMVDRQNRITPIQTSENQVRFNFGQWAAPYINVSSAAAFKRVIHMSQQIQSDCLSAEAEHYRRGRDTVHATAGATFWMLDDNWPAESWTSLEWGGRPKMLHYTAMRYNSEVAISSFCGPTITKCSTVTVHVSSERRVHFAGTLELRVVRWADGKVGPVSSTKVSIEAQSGFSTTLALADPLKAAECATPGDCFVAAQLVDAAGDLLAPVNHQPLTLWRDANLQPTKLTIVSATEVGDGKGSTNVTVSSSGVAPGVMVHCSSPSDFGAFDTNGVLLMPGKPATLLYTPRAFAPAGEHTPCTTAESFYAVAVNGLSDGGRLAMKTDEDVEAYGAKADGATFSGDAFNKAIAACSAAGGGTVHARGGGAYIVGGVELKSHVTLSIAPNSSVLGSSDASKWTRTQADLTMPPECDGVNLMLAPVNGVRLSFPRVISPGPRGGLFWASLATNFSIRGGQAGTPFGQGAIVGGAGQFFNHDLLRSNMFTFVQCTDFTVTDLRIRNSSAWTLVPIFSQRGVFRRLHIAQGSHPGQPERPDHHSNVK